MEDKNFERSMTRITYAFCLYILAPFMLTYLIFVLGLESYFLKNLFWGFNLANILSFSIGLFGTIILYKHEENDEKRY